MNRSPYRQTYLYDSNKVILYSNLVGFLFILPSMIIAYSLGYLGPVHISLRELLLALIESINPIDIIVLAGFSVGMYRILYKKERRYVLLTIKTRIIEVIIDFFMICMMIYHYHTGSLKSSLINFICLNVISYTLTRRLLIQLFKIEYKSN